jgi:hypothetical protein
MSIEVLATIGLAIAGGFGALLGIIYTNLRGSIDHLEEEISKKEEVCDLWKTAETKFKMDIIQRLTRLETLLTEVQE